MQSLYNSFETQYPDMCTYVTFCRYWPQKYIKPSPNDFGTCLCIICQNFKQKLEALKKRKFIGIHHDLDDIVKCARNDDFQPEIEMKNDIEFLAVEDKSNVNIAFAQWEKVKQTEISKNTGKVKGDKTMRISKHLAAEELGKVILEEYEEYKNHLDHDFIIRTELNKMIIEASKDTELAVLHIDWAEQHKITEIKEVQTAYFGGRYNYDIHTGYVYTKEDSHGFASPSDSSNHGAEAIHVAIKPKVEDLVRKIKTKFIIASDSPTSQYRNGKNIFLMKKLAMEFGISIRLLFTEAGHGKSPCDGVGRNMKT